MDEILLKEATISQPLPHSIEAEQAVLGGLMIKNEAFESISDVLVEKDFYKKDHQLIFAAMISLSDNSQPFDPITLSETLQAKNQLSTVGGAEYLVELTENTPSSANIQAYTQIVVERSIVRQLIVAASETIQKGFNPLGWDSSKLLAQAESRLQEIIENKPKVGGFKSVDSLIKEAVQRLDELFKSESDITGLGTGFSDLDKMTSGFQNSDLVIIAGRPSMGKTAFAMNVVEHAALNQNKPVLVFSLEMPANQLVVRMLSSLGKIDQTRIRSGNLLEDDWPRLSAAAQKLKNASLYIDDTPGISPFEMKNRIKKFIREEMERIKSSLESENNDEQSNEKLLSMAQPSLIVVDYLQLMNGTNQSEGRVQEISQISRELKGLAREYECPVVALSQLSRAVEQRPNKRPVNADLRESGAIEQDADVVTFIYRDEVYNEDSVDKGIAEIIIGKQRNGPIGTCRLAFMGKYTRFENLARNYQQDQTFG
jgi:replicative DNA helicase